MNFIIRHFKKLIQLIVDRVHGKPMDIVGIFLYLITSSLAIKVIYILHNLTNNPILVKPINPTLYGILIVLPMLTYHITLMGDKLKKNSTRISQFIITNVCTSIFAIGYISQIANITFVGWLNGISNIETIPFSMLEGNIRAVTFFFPLILISPMTIMSFMLIKEKDIRKSLTEYEIHLLLPNVMKSSDVTIDLKICEDTHTGDSCIVPEKKLFEHIWLQGGTGSGKTATVIRPLLGQLFGKKGYLNQNLKELSHQALKEGIATLTQPVSNYWFNNNFTMDYIVPISGKEKEFIEKFNKYIIGIRDKEEIVVDRIISGGKIELNTLKSDSKYQINVQIMRDDITFIAKETTITSLDSNKELGLGDKYKPIKILLGSSIEMKKDTDDENAVNRILKNDITKELEDKYQILLPQLEEGYNYKIEITEKGSGKIIYRNLGVTVIAPDGGLPKDAIKIAEDFGEKIHKIDPTMEEIKRGKISKFNPLLGDRPDKTGDIISSILISMEQSDGAASKAYFVNASVRAVRNVVILLKVMFPIVEKRQPNLNDLRRMLSDFNEVVPYVEEMKNDSKLKSRWESVITYFITSFYPPDVNDNGRVIIGSKVGSQRKKTEEAIGGIINQLDNFLTREEVQYILCPENDEESLKLAEVLENGECIAIATRQNDLGSKLGKAFALFFILSLQNEVLSRYSEDENPEIPHFLIIDEFPFYISDSTKIFFNFARKYKCSVLVAIQNMGQLKEVSDEFGETIFANTDTKILLSKSNVQDRKYWSEFFGTEKRFEMQTGVTTSSMMSNNPTYNEQRRGKEIDNKKVTEEEINRLHFKEAFYAYTNFKGRQQVGKGNTDFLDKQQIKKVEIKEYDFERFNPYSFEKYIKEQEQLKKKALKTDKHNSAIYLDMDKEDTNFQGLGNINIFDIVDTSNLEFNDLSNKSLNNKSINSNNLQCREDNSDIAVERSNENSDYPEEIQSDLRELEESEEIFMLEGDSYDKE